MVCDFPFEIGPAFILYAYYNSPWFRNHDLIMEVAEVPSEFSHFGIRVIELIE